MSLDLLMDPFPVGIIYDTAEYYAVFAVILRLLEFDFCLRLMLIEPKELLKWNEKDSRNIPDLNTAKSTVNFDIRRDADCSFLSEEGRPETKRIDERTTLLPHKPKRPKSGITVAFPTLAILLGSRRLRTAILGLFIWGILAFAFDAVIPLFVKHTFS